MAVPREHIPVNHHVDPTRREAHASLLGALPSRAVFRDGVGCVFAHGEEPIATYVFTGYGYCHPLRPSDRHPRDLK